MLPCVLHKLYNLCKLGLPAPKNDVMPAARSTGSLCQMDPSCCQWILSCSKQTHTHRRHNEQMTKRWHTLNENGCWRYSARGAVRRQSPSTTDRTHHRLCASLCKCLRVVRWGVLLYTPAQTNTLTHRRNEATLRSIFCGAVFGRILVPSTLSADAVAVVVCRMCTCAVYLAVMTCLCMRWCECLSVARFTNE